jgi:hypothetical protein
MNAMDMLPVAAIPALWHSVGPGLGYKDYMRVVPTADLTGFGSVSQKKRANYSPAFGSSVQFALSKLTF